MGGGVTLHHELPISTFHIPEMKSVPGKAESLWRYVSFLAPRLSWVVRAVTHSSDASTDRAQSVVFASGKSDLANPPNQRNDSVLG